ncbi:MAG: response regulator [Rickettsiales bacterium]|nr:response regulator [Rickettsiales bacterium]
MRPRILAVDDDDLNLAIVEEVIEDAGYQPLLASSGKEGLELLRDTAGIKVILLDWMMPEMTGIEVLGKIRGHSQFDDIKVIMLTALDTREQVAEAVKSGANDYIVKPFEPHTLIEKVRRNLLANAK